MSPNACWIALGWALLWSLPVSAQDSYVEGVLGQQFTGKIAGINVFPLLEFRAGVRVSDSSTLRAGLGGGGTAVRASSRASYDGSRMMVGNASMAWLWAFLQRDSFQLEGGLETGFWFSALWGKNDERDSAGSTDRYLEQVSLHYALLLGARIPISTLWTFSIESRLNAAMTAWDGASYNTGGLSVLFGLMRVFGPSPP